MSVHINDFHCFQFAARLLQVRAGMNQDFYAGVIHMSYNGSRLFMFCCITCFHWINIILWFSVYYCSVDVLRFSGQWTLLIWILVFQSTRWQLDNDFPMTVTVNFHIGSQVRLMKVTTMSRHPIWRFTSQQTSMARLWTEAYVTVRRCETTKSDIGVSLKELGQ